MTPNARAQGAKEPPSLVATDPSLWSALLGDMLICGLLGIFKINARLDKNHRSGLQRWGQPGQQHGLRIPLRILSRPTSMRRCLVSSFLADVTQQIHSFRASGVMAAQRPFAAASDSMARRKSDGSLWIVPPAIALVVMHQFSRLLSPNVSA